MKLAIVIITLTLCIFGVLFYPYKEPVKNTNYTIRMHLIDGSFKTQTFRLYEKCWFSVNGNSGHYSLCYSNEGSMAWRGTLKEAVIDYEIILITPSPTQ